MAKSARAFSPIFVVDHTDPGPRPLTHADTTDDAQYLVAALLSTRRYRGVTQYLVSWKGDWSAAEKTSWVDEDDVSEEILRDFKASGITLKSTPAPKASSPALFYDDEDEMVISSDEGSDDSGSEYDPDEDEDGEDDDDDDDDDDDEKMDVEDNADKPASKKLPIGSSVKSNRAISVSEQHGHSSVSPSPVPNSQVEEADEMHNRALVAAEMEAQAKADLEGLDASWEAHGDTLTLPVETVSQGPAMMQPVFQQPSQVPTVSQNGFAFDPMVNTLTLPVETFSQGPAMMQPVFQQPSQFLTVSQTGLAFDPVLTTEEDVYTADFLEFKATGEDHFGDSEEDAKGSVISEGEQARYDAMSPWPRM